LFYFPLRILRILTFGVFAKKNGFTQKPQKENKRAKIYFLLIYYFPNSILLGRKQLVIMLLLKNIRIFAQ